MTLLQNSEVKIDIVDDYYIKGSAASESSIEGIYAAGEIRNHAG